MGWRQQYRFSAMIYIWVSFIIQTGWTVTFASHWMLIARYFDVKEDSRKHKRKKKKKKKHHHHHHHHHKETDEFEVYEQEVANRQGDIDGYDYVVEDYYEKV